jgi:hypothetical protein
MGDRPGQFEFNGEGSARSASFAGRINSAAMHLKMALEIATLQPRPSVGANPLLDGSNTFGRRSGSIPFPVSVISNKRFFGAD